MKLTVLGATGSIGVSTLDVVARHPDRFEVVALTGNTRIELLEAQCLVHRPAFAVTGSPESAADLSGRLKAKKLNTEVLYGPESLQQVAYLPQVDAVMAAIVGAAGLPPTLAAAKAGKRVLLANKEALVMAGQLFMDEMAGGGGMLLPIDSEHNAVFQAMPPFQSGKRPPGVAKIILTASGGPFRTLALKELANVTVEQAVAHPNWSMGQKISVDSATMMNKGLELIEAHWLFGMAADSIDVVIHPQSVIHSMVEYIDGSVIAQMGKPDMRTPIAYALAWPERITSGVGSLNLFQVGRLDFEPPDYDRFPCLALAYAALREGGDRGAVLNAANEVAVQAFLEQKITYLQIAQIVRSVLDQRPCQPMRSIEAVLETDTASRRLASIEVARVGH